MSVANASAMPPAISEIFEILRQDTIMLHASRDTFHELFGTERSAGILSDVAPLGFAMVRNALGHEIIMGVSRITDPKTTGRGAKANENATIEQLIHAIEQNGGDSSFIAHLRTSEQEIRDQCKSLRDLRNKVLGHRDLPTMLKPADNPLPPLKAEELKTAIQQIGAFLCQVSAHFIPGLEIGFTPLDCDASGIVNALGQWIEQRKQYQRQLREKVCGQG